MADMKERDQSRESSTIDRQHPYAGLYPFQEMDSDYFFGRERETRDLEKLIISGTLTIVFGKSGVGKTSLLRAGLIPKLSGSYYLPIYVRIDFASKEKSPIAQVKEIAAAKIRDLDPTAPGFGDSTLWEYFSSVKILKGYVKPLLFFDQFEEMFTAAKDNLDGVNEFVTEIADLVENRVPVSVRERLEKEKKTIAYKNMESDFRVIFSLREDYLAHLETLYRYIPSIRSSRYRVGQMSGKDAVDAVLKPGKEIIDDAQVGVEIIKKIPGASGSDYRPYEAVDESWQTKKIEPFLLSLFCFQVNEKRLNRGAKKISRSLIQDIRTEDIIKDYYEGNIGRFDPNVKIAIEDLLLTDEGYRKLQDINSLKRAYRVTDADIEGLVDRRIIRKEVRLGIDYVELIHDVLAPILKESREKREEEKRRKREALLRKRRNRRMIATAAAVIAAILAVSIGFAVNQNAKIKRQRERAALERQRAKAYEWAAYSIDVLKKDRDRDLSFRLAESAYGAEKGNLVAYRALLSVFYDGGFYDELFENRANGLSEFASEKSDFFAAFSPDGQRIVTAASNRAMLWHLDGSRADAGEFILEEEGLEFRPNGAFSADGKYIVSCTKSDDRVLVLDIIKKEIRPLTLAGGVRSLALSPSIDDKSIIAASRDKRARLFDLGGKLITTFTGHNGHVNSAAFSNDGKHIVTASWDQTVRRWDLAGSPEGEPFTGSTSSVNSAAFSPDGQRIVTADAGGMVRLWNVDTGDSRILAAHNGAAVSAQFSPDGKYVLTGSEDRTVRLVTLNNFLVIEFKGFTSIIHSASFSPDGKYILIAPARGPAQLRLIDAGEIIRLVNERGNVRRLSKTEQETYNLSSGIEANI